MVSGGVITLDLLEFNDSSHDIGNSLHLLRNSLWLDEDDETLLFLTCHTAIFRKQQEVAMDSERMEERIADYLLSSELVSDGLSP